jgi:Cu/Ag efflux protein CusF
MTKKHLFKLSLAALVAVPLALAGCKKSDAPAADAPAAVEAKAYTITGEVKGFQGPHQEAILLKHDKIEGFMDAMTMGFELKDKEMGKAFKVGDKVSGTLSVAGDEIFITELHKVK